MAHTLNILEVSDIAVCCITAFTWRSCLYLHFCANQVLN